MGNNKEVCWCATTDYQAPLPSVLTKRKDTRHTETALPLLSWCLQKKTRKRRLTAGGCKTLTNNTEITSLPPQKLRNGAKTKQETTTDSTPGDKHHVPGQRKRRIGQRLSNLHTPKCASQIHGICDACLRRKTFHWNESRHTSKDQTSQRRFLSFQVFTRCNTRWRPLVILY